MSSGLQKTEAGGDSAYDQYTSQSSGLASSPPKSSGQLGGTSAPAEDPSAQAAQERGEKTAANIRYGQGISEGGMGGTTTGQSGETDAAESDTVGREAQGYTGKESSGEIGA